MRPDRHLRSVVASGGGVGEAPPPARRPITLLGARGGHGTTTVACALAVMCAAHGPTTLAAADIDGAAAVLGLPRPTETPVPVVGTLRLDRIGGSGGRATIVDGGPIADAQPVHAGLRLAVLRGPCYVALATLLAHPGAYDAVIVVEEPERSLTARDVTDVLDVPVAAVVRTSATVARTIDAGLIVARAHRLPELAELRRLVRPVRAIPAPPDRHTDLQRPEVRRCVAQVACRDHPSQQHVVQAWNVNFGAEHRSTRCRRRRLLPRRGRLVARGVLHRRR